MNKNAKYSIAVVILIIAAIAIYSLSNRSSAGWETYVQKDYGFSVNYPSNWIIEDALSSTSTCCLFIARWQYATTTEANASGTPQEKVTATETIKLQIGPYVREGEYDPFKAGTTTEVKANGSTFYFGTSGALDYYLLPRDEKTGIGAGVFRYNETPQKDRDVAKEIATSLKYVATTTDSVK